MRCAPLPPEASSSRPAHAQPCVLASTDRVWLLNAATAVLLFASLVVFFAVHGPGPVTAADAAGVEAGQQPAGYTANGVVALPATITESPGTVSGGGRGTSAAPSADSNPESSLAADGIPSTALAAYQQAAQWENAVDPACQIPWPLLAAIGRVESDHGRFAGAVLHTDGTSTPRVIGIALDGHGTALIRDTDAGRLDGDRVYDRAVGPMQFIPSTWASYGVDANHDGTADPFNIFDAAAAAARYLCAAASPLTTSAAQTRAVLAYNHSDVYVATVLGLERVYATGAGVVVPVTAAPVPTAVTAPPLPPVNPAPPPAVTPTPSPTQPSGSSAPPTPATTSAEPTPTSQPPPDTSSAPTDSPSAPTTAPSTDTSGDVSPSGVQSVVAPSS